MTSPYLSLFSGIGGFDLGLDRAGFVCKGQVEINRHCRRVLAKHWPQVKRKRDVTQVQATDFPHIDLICGGFPCQDLSVAGRRKGLVGERSGLFFEFARIIEAYAPRWVLVENVPGLLSSNEGRDMGTVLATLGKLGYGWAYRVLDAQYFGVAQRRRRVFIVGCLGDTARAATVLFEAESAAETDPPLRTKRSSPIAVVQESIIGRKPENGMSFRPKTDETTFTLNCFGKYVVATADGIRYFTPTEYLRLQGFPDDWLSLAPPLKEDEQYAMAGNAVCVPVAEWIGRRLAAAK